MVKLKPKDKQMSKFALNLICMFIPLRKLRKKLRNYIIIKTEWKNILNNKDAASAIDFLDHKFKSSYYYKNIIINEIKARNKMAQAAENFNSNVSVSESFSDVYNKNVWSSDESHSGGGSEIGTTTRIREFLTDLFKKYDIKSMLDVPCGDYNWMNLVNKDDIKYIGGDIVRNLIDENNRKYGKENVSFETIDITKDNLPKVDLIFCKDCLQHLSNENVILALANFKRSGAKYLLVTSYPLTLENWDIANGDCRPLNLFLPPFNMTEFIEKIQEIPTEYKVEQDKIMFLYKL